ncbi:MAG: hypothetical protein WC711_02340 [Candidatus Staskawiczbacteria bacterium]
MKKAKMGPGPYTVIVARDLLRDIYNCNCGIGNEELDLEKHASNCPLNYAITSDQNQFVSVRGPDGREWGNLSGFWFRE